MAPPRGEIFQPNYQATPTYGGVGTMTLIRISNRLAVLGKWAEVDPPRPPAPVPAYALHEFAYAVGEPKTQAT